MKHQNKITILTMFLAPALLIAWYFTQAFQFLFVLGVFYVLSLIAAGFTLFVVSVVVPGFKNAVTRAELDAYTTQMKAAVTNPLTYPAYIIMYSMLFAFLYFGHYLLFLNLFAILIVSLVTRLVLRTFFEKSSNDSASI